MARPRTYKSHGLVLKHAPLGEADRLVTLYTPDRGKLRGVARGARRPRSRLAGHLEPLTHVRVSVAEGRSLDTIAEAETVRSFRALREDLHKITHGVYMAELVDRFSADQSPSPAVFSLLRDSLGRLEDAADPSLLLRFFEVQLLAVTGFGPELGQCVECNTPVQPGDHLFSYASGGVICPRCTPPAHQAVLSLSLNAIKVLRHLQRGPYARVERLRVAPGLHGELERLLRNYVRYVLDRDVNSAAFVGLGAPAGR